MPGLVTILLRVFIKFMFISTMIIDIGDLNYDLVKPDKSQPLHTVCDVFDFTNLMKTPTCFMKDAHPSIFILSLQIDRPFCLTYQISHAALVTGTI